MKTIHEQIAQKCRHFNGVMNKECEAGVCYDDVRVDRPYKFPCLQQGGICAKANFLTTEEVNAKVEAIRKATSVTIDMYAKIKEKQSIDGLLSGNVQCICGGKVNYAISDFNQHIRASCKECGVSIVE